MITHIPEQHPLRQLFATLTEQSFIETLGWPDFNITHYLSNLLVEFVHVDNLHRIKDQEGKTVETVVELLYEAELGLTESSEEREREVHRHIGDFTLFMAGLFPEYLSYIKAHGLIHHPDFLVDYMKAGKRSYGIVATCSPYKTPLFTNLSIEFELCVTGLGFVREDLNRMQDQTFLAGKKIIIH